ncbi:DNA polymerase I [Candidatus Rhabdochlamydia oedothoracis]|uniref:DNA polymerase I n=1 Tax=Candidatus Rhabdochlamydia oedothoracis TaxID=2720720 RepID=A0ABX8V791_9BACT|nr:MULTISPECIES: DNA polymerase I [Rhabdochlamydia]KAG6559177.1 DNA polymerase I [Candidatus Rhabdochlamydia sp. W815]QYF49452.1 DNA polymerase I [Candidatus Rhabdochlamydia oedothoracis]
MNKIYIVDAVNLLFRAYYAISPMTNLKGESTHALYGFIRSLYKLIKDFSPEYVICVFDGPDNKKSRTKIYSEYKSHRTSMPLDLVEQLQRSLYFCEIAGIPFLSIEGIEADDTMGSIAKWAEKEGSEVFICSSDKDLCQLISDKIHIIHLHKDNLLIDEQKVKDQYGVEPSKIVDFLAITGDSSDNIPGLEGFGPKTASLLLNQYGSLEGILANVSKIKGKKGEILLKQEEIALMSKQLARIDIHIETPTQPSFFQLKNPDTAKIKQFFQEMDFLSLLKELPLNTEASQENYSLVNDVESLEQLLKKLERETKICIDTEATHLHPMLAQLVGIGFAVQAGHAWYVPLNGFLSKEVVIKKIKPLLEKKEIGFIGHNIKYDLHVLKNETISLQSIHFDTILASYLLHPNTQRHSLDELSLKRLGREKISIESLIGKGKKQTSMLDVSLDLIKDYCCEDVDCTLQLKEQLEPKLQEQGLFTLFTEVEIPLIFVLAEMERNGIYINVNTLEKTSLALSSKILHLEQQIYELSGQKFNVNSPKQLSSVLFEKLQIKPPKKTTTGYSTSIDVLDTLKKEYPIVKKIIEYRTLEKLRSTYADSLPLQVNPVTKRVHCTFNQSTAATGRLSCQNPNLQNIPVRTEEGKKIRQAFEPQELDYSFLSADYSQIELRILAHLSEDPALIRAFNNQEDIHSYTASLVFGVPLLEVTPTMRYQAKAVNFGILYGKQAFSLSQDLNISYKEAEIFIVTYFQRYQKVKDFIEFCEETARKTGKVVTITGRQRPIAEIHNKNPSIRAFAKRLAINTPLQGSAADLIKIAMIRVDNYLKQSSKKAKMLLQVHDELLFEAPDQDILLLGKEVKQIMESVMSLKVPLVVDIAIGKNWSEC